MQTPAWPFVAEYLQRKSLAALGITSRFDDLDVEHAEILLTIDELMAKKQQDLQRASRVK